MLAICITTKLYKVNPTFLFQEFEIETYPCQEFDALNGKSIEAIPFLEFSLNKASLLLRELQVKIACIRTSLVVQWLIIHLPTQRTQVRSLVQEDSTCHGATKPMCHNY